MCKAEVKFQVDSGASVNVISADLVADKKLDPTAATMFQDPLLSTIQ